MSKIEAIAGMSIRPGMLEGFKRQAAEIIRQAQEKDTKTLRYDWFLNRDQTRCRVLEVYESSEGLVEHVKHIVGPRDRLFAEFADKHAIAIFGEPSAELTALAHHTHDLDLEWYSFLGGLRSR